MSTDHVTRREFMKSLGLLAGTLPWIATLCSGPQGGEDDVAPVRLGVIGIGSRGTKLLLHLQTIPGVEITAICDDYPPHLYDGKRLAGAGVATYRNYRDLLTAAEVDGVVIATPPHLHARMALDAMEAGKAVFCEKIMALTIEDCQAMRQAQQQTGQILQIGFQRLFDVRYLQARQAIQEGRIGTITCLKAHWHRNDSWRRPVKSPDHERRLNWRLYRETSGGLMVELGAHQLQVINWLLGTHPARVIGSGSINYWDDGRETFDNVSAIFEYPENLQFSLTSILSNGHYGAVEQIMGDQGTIELEAGRFYLEKPPPSPGIKQLLGDLERRMLQTIPIGGPSWVQDSETGGDPEYLVDDIYIPSATQLELEAFVESIREGGHMPELLDEAYNASVAALLGSEAVREGRPVVWPEEDR